jgi:hypothetical protein
MHNFYATRDLFYFHIFQDTRDKKPSTKKKADEEEPMDTDATLDLKKPKKPVNIVLIILLRSGGLKNQQRISVTSNFCKNSKGNFSMRPFSAVIPNF